MDGFQKSPPGPEIKDIPLPKINSVTALFPCVFKLMHQGKTCVEIYANGEVKIYQYGHDKNAELFWNAVRNNILSQQETQLKRDIAFIAAFMQGKGIFFTNPAEKIEFSVWLGEIMRRYGIPDRGT